mmetsp:Transcript_8444/g.24807  ORF Transcript_8444/g.24807 Transcript_8444/m.24807 type:complete len:309 (+) Transcript_8444:75-1001(+)
MATLLAAAASRRAEEMSQRGGANSTLASRMTSAAATWSMLAKGNSPAPNTSRAAESAAGGWMSGLATRGKHGGRRRLGQLGPTRTRRLKHSCPFTVCGTCAEACTRTRVPTCPFPRCTTSSTRGASCSNCASSAVDSITRGVPSARPRRGTQHMQQSTACVRLRRAYDAISSSPHPRTTRCTRFSACRRPRLPPTRLKTCTRGARQDSGPFLTPSTSRRRCSSYPLALMMQPAPLHTTPTDSNKSVRGASRESYGARVSAFAPSRWKPSSPCWTLGGVISCSHSPLDLARPFYMLRRQSMRCSMGAGP